MKKQRNRPTVEEIKNMKGRPHGRYRIFLEGHSTVKRVYKPKFNTPEVISSFVEARTFEDFKRMVEIMGVPQYISFGDVLWDNIPTMECAKWLVEWCESHENLIPEFKVHSKRVDVKYEITEFLLYHGKRLKSILDPDTRKKDVMQGKTRGNGVGFDIDITNVEDIFLQGGD